MNSRIGKGLRKTIPNGQEDGRTARSGLRPTDKSVAMQRTSSSQVGLDDSLKVLAERVTQVEGASESGLAQQLDTVTQQVDQVKGENEELRAFFQEAMQEAERLKKENEELRKLGEDAVLDQQLSKALQETDKLKLAADAYKKELLQQKVTELQSELAQTSKRLKVAEEENTGLTQALKGAKGAARTAGMGSRTDSLRSLDRQSVTDADPAARQAVLSRLQGPPENRGDLDELLAEAAKALKDAGAADSQLADAVAANAKLQADLDQLNDTVFSKSFRAPSAWAEREVKYKMDKKAWDTQVDRLQTVINKLKAENVEYRNNSKTDQFEARIQELQQKLQDTDGAKVSAQRALHELQLDMQAQVQKYTQLQQARRHQDTSADEGISSMIEEFDRQHVGAAQPAKAAPKPSATGRQAKALPADAAAAQADDPAQSQEAASGTHVQGVIVNMNAHNIGTRQPTAAPQEETDTHMHNQLTPDVISTTPSPHPTPSSHHPTQAHQPVQLPGADSAYGVDPVSSTQQASKADLDPIADSFQEPGSTSSPIADLVDFAKDLLPNSIAGATPSTQDKQPPASSHTAQPPTHQQPAAGSSEAHDRTSAASQPGLQTNVDDQSQGSASQLQQAAEGAAQAQSQSSMPSPQQQQLQDPTGSSQPSEVHASYQHKGFVPSMSSSQQQQVQQPAGPSQPSEVHASYQHKDFAPSMPSSQRQQVQEPAGSSQPPEVHASYQHKDFVPSTAHHQPQSHTATDHMQGQSQAAPSPHDASAPQPPHAQLEPSSQDRQAAFNQPEPSSSQSPAAQASAGPQQTAQPGVASEAEDQATSQDTTSASTGSQDAVSGQLAQQQLGRSDQLTANAAAGLPPGQGSDAKAGGHAAASDVQASDSSHRQAEQEGTSSRDEQDESADDNDDELLTLADAVQHVARSTRQSRANSSEALDELDPSADPSAGPSDYPAPPTPAAPPTQPQAGPKVSFGDAGHLSLPSTSARSMARGSVDVNGASSLSEASEQWTEERVRQLEEDKAAIERLWGEHAQENDIGVLKFKLAEFESRCEMYEAQVTKLQRSMERSDEDKAQVEEQLATAIALNHSGNKQGLAAMRERLQDVVSGRSSKTSQLEERLKEAEQQLQQSYRERDRLEKQRAKLEHELASWSTKLGVDIPLPASESVDESDASTSSKGRVLQRWRSSASGFGVDGLSEGEVEVMHLREENEALMDSLVRTKVDLAETEGEYLKTKRSLIRADERLASMSERIESLKAALSKAGLPLPSMTDSPSARSDTSTNPFGTPRSVVGTPKTTAPQALEAHL